MSPRYRCGSDSPQGARFGNRKLKVLAQSVVAVLVLAAVTRPAFTQYTWKNVRMVASGFITGIAYHPNVQNLVYARTDIGGLYRSTDGGTTRTGLANRRLFLQSRRHRCQSPGVPGLRSYFRRAAEWNSSLQGLDRNLGRAEFLCKNYREAIAPLSRYLDQHADDDTVRSELGLSFFQIGRYEEVVRVLDPIKSVFAPNPELAWAYTTAVAKLDRK